ncbi:MAG: hypothetical protein ACLP7Q_27095 [Isosphaeraceae bacterium]
MDTHADIIPPPPVVRERLAALLRQTSLLRRLLRLSVTAAIEKDRQSAPETRQKSAGREGGQ